MKEPKFLILDKDFNTLFHLDHYISIIWTDRYYECGDFEIYCGPSEEVLEYCKIGNYLWYNNSPKLMVIEQLSYSADVENGLKIAIKGRSLESVLDRRVSLNKVVSTTNPIESLLYMIIREAIIDPYIQQPNSGGVWSNSVWFHTLYYPDTKTKANELISDDYTIYDCHIATGAEMNADGYDYEAAAGDLGRFAITTKIIYGPPDCPEEDRQYVYVTDVNGTIQFNQLNVKGDIVPWWDQYDGPVLNSTTYELYSTFHYNKKDLDRRIDNFVFKRSEDQDIANIKVECEFENGTSILDIVTTLCKKYTLGFRVYATDEDKIEFMLFKGADRSYEQDENPWIVFTPKYNNVISNSYDFDSGSGVCNYLYSSNGVFKKSTGETGINRRELFTTATTAKDVNEFFKEHQQKEKSQFSLETRFHTQYGVDYYIGDIVQMENEFGIQSRLRITEYITSIEPSGFEMYPTLTDVMEEEDNT